MPQDKTAFGMPSGLSNRTKGLLGAGVGALGLAGAGVGGYALGKRRYGNIGHRYELPNGELVATGDRFAVENFREGMEEIQSGARDPMDINQLVEEAQAQGVNLKMASAVGRSRAHYFVEEMSKMASTCAHNLCEMGMLSKEAAQDFINGSHDLRKCARLFEVVGVAAYLHDNPR